MKLKHESEAMIMAVTFKQMKSAVSAYECASKNTHAIIEGKLKIREVQGYAGEIACFHVFGNGIFDKPDLYPVNLDDIQQGMSVAFLFGINEDGSPNYFYANSVEEIKIDEDGLIVVSSDSIFTTDRMALEHAVIEVADDPNLTLLFDLSDLNQDCALYEEKFYDIGDIGYAIETKGDIEWAGIKEEEISLEEMEIGE